MLTKYNIEFSTPLHQGEQVYQHHTDDPVAAESFLAELLDRGLHIREIKHEGVPLARSQSDQMIKNAANLVASRRICASLRLKPEEERFRFGFAA